MKNKCLTPVTLTFDLLIPKVHGSEGTDQLDLESNFDDPSSNNLHTVR